MVLYRPTGLNELCLVHDSQLKAWPARLSDQPIFYPVTNYNYARQIAKDWNTKSESSVGFVTKFRINDDFINQYITHIVGDKTHEEYWIPSEDLNKFNENIIDNISVIDAYFGNNYTGYIPNQFLLKNKTAKEQFVSLASILDYNGMDFQCEISSNCKAIFLNILYWCNLTFAEKDLCSRTKESIIQAIEKTWQNAFPNIPLPKYENYKN